MSYMRAEAGASYRDKMGRMGLAEGDGSGEKVSTAAMGEDIGIGHSGPAKDGSVGMAQGEYAEGYQTAAENEATMRRKNRLDRPGYKKGGRVKGTTVNVIIAGSKPEAPPPMPMPPPMAAPPPAPPMPMPPPGAGPGGPPLPGVPMGRAMGGRVGSGAGGSGVSRAGSVGKGAGSGNVSAGRNAASGTIKTMNAPMERYRGPPRKNGGVVPDMDAGAGGGKGRLEKIKAYGKKA